MVDEGTQDSSLDFYAELVTLRAQPTRNTLKNVTAVCFAIQ